MKSVSYSLLVSWALVASYLPDLRAGEATAFPGSVSSWNGYSRHDFELDGFSCVVVEPAKAAEGRPWIWRARFFGHEPQTDLALLARGYHLAYCDVADLYGSPGACARWSTLHSYLTTEYGLAEKVALEGMSRGGLVIYNWAAENPEKVACIYGDAPVCDFKSWPGGRGAGPGSPGDWKRCLEAYGLSEEEALAYRQNPIDRLEPLARARVPILHVIGDADVAVPPAENSEVIENRYRELGGEIQVISKKGIGHHPHSLRDPRPIVSFVVGRCRAAGADRSPERPFEGNVSLRGRLMNSKRVFEQERKGHVAFLGGSITEMEGYRPLISAALSRRFPDTDFTFTNAGIASTCSTTGAFRLATDVLRQGPVDLFFVEFAVNDDQDAAHSRTECIRGMEGVVRRVREHNPCADIVMVHFVNPEMLDTIQHGEVPLTIGSHEEVARHYEVSSVNLAREVADAILAGRLTWKEYGGTHPARAGNELCSRMIETLLDGAWDGVEILEKAPHSLPAPLDSGNYGQGHSVDPAGARIVRGWTLGVPEWSKLAGQTRDRFRGELMLCGTEPGAEVLLEFDGIRVGVYVVAGPDAGTLEGSIDGTPFEPIDLFHRFSSGLHYPRTVLLGPELAPGRHALSLRISEATSSSGHAARILRFAVNGAP